MDLTLSAIKITKVDFLFGLGFENARHKNVLWWFVVWDRRSPPFRWASI